MVAKSLAWLKMNGGVWPSDYVSKPPCGFVKKEGELRSTSLNMGTIPGAMLIIYKRRTNSMLERLAHPHCSLSEIVVVWLELKVIYRMGPSAD